LRANFCWSYILRIRKINRDKLVIHQRLDVAP